MPRKKTAPKKITRKTKSSSRPVSPPIMSAMPTVYLEKLKQNKILYGALGVGIIVLLLLAFPLRFLVVPAIINGQPIFSWQYVGELHKKAGEEILTQMINQKLLEQEIANQGVQVTQNEIDGQVKKIEDSIGTESGGLDAALSLQGMKRDDLIQQIRFQLQLEKLVKGTITVSDEDINKELSENAVLYKGLSQVDAATTAAESLRGQKMSSAFAQWFQSIRTKAKIQNFFQSPVVPLPPAPSK